MAKVDKADTPHTFWWVVFNNPGECDVKYHCAPGDLFNPDVEAAIFNASGAISAASGALKRNGKPAKGGVINVDIAVIAGEGVGNGSQNGPPGAPAFFGRPMNPGNGLCAEIHVDINEHEFNGDWVQELTYPENPQGFSIFPPADGCSDD